MKRFCVIFGTRPEAIKLFPLVMHLRERGAEVLLLSTEQHTGMLRGVCEAFSLFPDLTLSARGGGEGLLSLLSRYLRELEGMLSGERFDGVIVQGDTLSAYAGALFGFFSEIAVYHIEAGLRSHDPTSPYPEEMLRRSIGTMAHHHFAPTVYARENLLAEGVAPSAISLVGNTVADAMRYFCRDYVTRMPPIRQVILTLHRRETVGAGHREILSAVRELSLSYPEIPILFPVHENPALRALASELLGDLSGVTLSHPLPPNEFYKHLFSARLVMTDSGGVQEEAALFGIPTLVLRECTEREAELRRGQITLAGVRREAVLSSALPYFASESLPTPDTSFLFRESPSERIAAGLL